MGQGKVKRIIAKFCHCLVKGMLSWASEHQKLIRNGQISSSDVDQVVFLNSSIIVLAHKKTCCNGTTSGRHSAQAH
jgi:hypothetical protein